MEMPTCKVVQGLSQLVYRSHDDQLTTCNTQITPKNNVSAGVLRGIARSSPELYSVLILLRWYATYTDPVSVCSSSVYGNAS